MRPTRLAPYTSETLLRGILHPAVHVDVPRRRSRGIAFHNPAIRVDIDFDIVADVLSHQFLGGGCAGIPTNVSTLPRDAVLMSSALALVLVILVLLLAQHPFDCSEVTWEVGAPCACSRACLSKIEAVWLRCVAPPDNLQQGAPRDEGRLLKEDCRSIM